MFAIYYKPLANTPDQSIPKIIIASSPPSKFIESLLLHYISNIRLATPPLSFVPFLIHRSIRYGFPSLITMRKVYSQCCSGQGVPCRTPSPHRLVPPLVSGGVFIGASVKVYQYLWLLNVWLWLPVPCRKTPISRHPPIKFEQKGAPVRSPLSDNLPTCYFRHSLLSLSFT